MWQWASAHYLSRVPFVNHKSVFLCLSISSFIEWTDIATCSSATFRCVTNGFNNPDASFSEFPSLETSNSHLPEIEFVLVNWASGCIIWYLTILTWTALATAGIQHNQEGYQTSFLFLTIKRQTPVIPLSYEHSPPREGNRFHQLITFSSESWTHYHLSHSTNKLKNQKVFLNIQ